MSSVIIVYLQVVSKVLSYFSYVSDTMKNPIHFSPIYSPYLFIPSRMQSGLSSVKFSKNRRVNPYELLFQIVNEGNYCADFRELTELGG